MKMMNKTRPRWSDRSNVVARLVLAVVKINANLDVTPKETPKDNNALLMTANALIVNDRLDPSPETMVKNVTTMQVTKGTKDVKTQKDAMSMDRTVTKCEPLGIVNRSLVTEYIQLW